MSCGKLIRVMSRFGVGDAGYSRIIPSRQVCCQEYDIIQSVTGPLTEFLVARYWLLVAR